MLGHNINWDGSITEGNAQILPVKQSLYDKFEIVGLSVISGIGIELRKLFPTISWTRETLTNPPFPHFFVQQLSFSANEERKNYWWIDYLINVQYRISSNPQAVGNLLEQLNNIGFRMVTELNKIYWNDIPVFVREPRYEIQEGILQYFCNIRVQGTKPIEEYEKMLRLILNKELIV